MGERMVIKPLKKLYGENGNRISANNERKRMIRELLGNKNLIDSIFSRLWKELKLSHLDTVKTILEEELFFEILPSSFITDVHKLRLDDDKLEKLKTSYELFALTGAGATWWRIMNVQKFN